MNLHDGSVVGKSGKNWRNDEEDEDEADEACSGQFANVPGIVKYYFQYSRLIYLRKVTWVWHRWCMPKNPHKRFYPDLTAVDRE